MESLLHLQGATEHEDGLLEYLEDIIGTSDVRLSINV